MRDEQEHDGVGTMSVGGVVNRAIASADVLVLGAGPGGMVAGLRLASQGVDTAVIEARGATAEIPNVVDMASEGISIVRDLGGGSLFVGRTARSELGAERAAIALRALTNGLRDLAPGTGLAMHYGQEVVGLLRDARTGVFTVQLASGRFAQGRAVINATGGRAGFEAEYGMALQRHPDYTWFGATRVPHIPDLPTGERIGQKLGLVRNDRIDKWGDPHLAYDPLPLPPGVEPWRSTEWTGWQNPIDGLSMFQTFGSYDLERLSLLDIGQQLLAPAWAFGEHRVLDAPRLLRASSASVEQAHNGWLLGIGDAAGRAHPKHMVGTRLAVTDGDRAAWALIEARGKSNAEAMRVLDRFESETLEAHAAIGSYDGSRVMADDPLAALANGRDMIELPWSLPAGVGRT